MLHISSWYAFWIGGAGTLFYCSCRFPHSSTNKHVSFFLAPRLGFRTFDNTVSKICILEITKENNKSEPIFHWEDPVRIILVWCG